MMNNSTEERLVASFKEKGLTFATAESCTGGLVAKTVTDVAGSSEVFLGGVVSYSNEVKMKILGVKEETLRAVGAVSEEAAREMARGAAERLGADVAVSTTGIAGPTGGVPGKPVGTVCFGVASKDGTRSETRRFGKDLSRDEIRRAATEHALKLALDECERLDLRWK